MKPTRQSIVAAIRLRGSNALDLRDAAHEALHALEAKVPLGRWTREEISAAVKAMGRSEAAASELLARAVEQIVCARLGVECPSVEACMLTAVKEAAHYREAFVPYDVGVAAVKRGMGSIFAKLFADRIVALGTEPPILSWLAAKRWRHVYPDDWRTIPVAKLARVGDVVIVASRVTLTAQGRAKAGS